MKARCCVWFLDGLGWGGAERLAWQWAATPEGSATHLVCWRGLPASLPGVDRQRVHSLRARRLWDAIAFLRWLRLLRRLRPELIHCHLRYALFWGAAAAWLLRFPCVATLHVLPPTAASASFRERLRRRLERWLLNRSWLTVLAVSEAQRAAWERAGLRAGRARVLPNGVVALAPPQKRQPDEPCVFLTVAVVRERKGFRHLLAAMPPIRRRLPQCRFVWVGDGPDMEALRQAVAAAKQPLELPGASRCVETWLAGADIFLFPSEEEALPTAVLEAMAAQVPVIASNLPAIAEAAGGSVVLVPPGDPAALARAAVRLALDPQRRARQAAAQFERWRQRYSLEAWRGNLVQLYAQMADAGPRCAASEVEECGRQRWKRPARTT